jgi:hypothetical protein
VQSGGAGWDGAADVSDYDVIAHVLGAADTDGSQQLVEG